MLTTIGAGILVLAGVGAAGFFTGYWMGERDGFQAGVKATIAKVVRTPGGARILLRMKEKEGES